MRPEGVVECKRAFNLSDGGPLSFGCQYVGCSTIHLNHTGGLLGQLLHGANVKGGGIVRMGMCVSCVFGGVMWVSICIQCLARLTVSD